MRRLLIAALVVSLLVHAWALFGIDFGMFGESEPELPPLQAELRPLPPPAPAVPAPLPAPVVEAARAEPPAAAPEIAENRPSTVDAVAPSEPVDSESAAVPPPAPVPEPMAAALAGGGRLAFVVVKESLGMQIGRAVHRWEFAADGSYRLHAMIETSGLAALIKPLRQEHESRGRLGPYGLQPEQFRVFRNGRPRGENADFDWSTAEVRLERDGSVHRVAPGTQDLLSLNYQLAYLKAPENGATIGVVTGRKYERYALDSFGEEEIETPAGRFRTLHLRAAGETLSEIWIALDHHRLPVKIRFTDRKGDSYTQLVTELDGAEPAPPQDLGKP